MSKKSQITYAKRELSRAIKVKDLTEFYLLISKPEKNSEDLYSLRNQARDEVGYGKTKATKIIELVQFAKTESKNNMVPEDTLRTALSIALEFEDASRKIFYCLDVADACNGLGQIDVRNLALSNAEEILKKLPFSDKKAAGYRQLGTYQAYFGLDSWESFGKAEIYAAKIKDEYKKSRELHRLAETYSGIIFNSLRKGDGNLFDMSRFIGMPGTSDKLAVSSREITRKISNNYYAAISFARIALVENYVGLDYAGSLITANDCINKVVTHRYRAYLHGLLGSSKAILGIDPTSHFTAARIAINKISNPDAHAENKDKAEIAEKLIAFEVCAGKDPSKTIQLFAVALGKMGRANNGVRSCLLVFVESSIKKYGGINPGSMEKNLNILNKQLY